MEFNTKKIIDYLLFGFLGTIGYHLANEVWYRFISPMLE